MKELKSLSIGRMLNLEYGQHIKSIYDGINLLGGGTLVTDLVFKAYLDKLKDKSVAYDKAMVQIFKSDETAKIEAADLVRDNAVTTARRVLYVSEHTTDESEHLAFASLQTLFRTYGNVQSMNFEEESNGIDNLVDDLNGTKYNPHVTTLGIGSKVTKMSDANAAFKNIFKGRTQETASKEVFDVKLLRSDLKITYNDMINYVLAMAKAHDTDEFNKSLNLINAVRDYYDTLLAKRKPAKKGETPTPIPPME
jgi:hypothetical protein